jgi:Flp pilus assembly protein CpaB
MGAGRGRRTGIILIIIILVVILLAVGGLFLFQQVLGGRGVVSPAEPTTAPPPTRPPTIDVVVAARDIPRGRRLTLEDLDVMAWPLLAESPPPIGALTLDEEQGTGFDQIVGRIARVDILVGSPVLENMITPSDQPTDLASVGSDAALLVPPGSVAVAVPLTRLSSVAYALRQGDHVDVLMSFRFMNVDEEFQTKLPNHAVQLVQDEETGEVTFTEYPLGREEIGAFGNTIVVVPGDGPEAIQQTTQLVINNAIVLRVGNWPSSDLNAPLVVTPAATPTPDESATDGQPTEGEGEPTAVPQPPAPDVVTLAMSRQDALVLKYAAELEVPIDFALRSVVDNEVQDIVTDPVTLSYIINNRGVTPPEPLPVALDPRADILSTFEQQLEASATGEGGGGGTGGQ